MCKKLGLTALVVVGVLVALSWIGLLPYVTTWVKRAPEEFQKNVPPEAKIERLKVEIEAIEPDLDRHRSDLAAKWVDIKKLEEKVALDRAKLKITEEKIRAAYAKVEAGETFYTSTGREVPKDKVQAELTEQYQSFERAEARLQSDEKLLESRKKGYDNALSRLEEMKRKKQDLINEVATLESDLQQLRQAQTENEINIDDSQLSRVIKLRQEVRDQIDTQAKELELKKADTLDTQVKDAIDNKVETDKSYRKMGERFGNTKVAEKK
jgi:DNA repair exonuclease SbcCD ATPase subunit